MFDQRTGNRRLVRWKAAVIPVNTEHVIQAFCTEVAPKGLAMFCKEQLQVNTTYRIIIAVPDLTHSTQSYVEVYGKPVYSSLVGSNGEFRTGMKLTEVSPEYKAKLEQYSRNQNV
ncbi:hypothetical protein [Parachitinimonas caeni]|uniref:PilZ domain-containing protein n=1 Tax=Parachitinimonas caeni TaxID=3031301 RepID=A0ABT7DXF5_9NEIS|nr:hypothetical protein [Parachitinimonas caeni]MDK2123327.1 hypothetical protein [Parachitinimonas caeni]